MRYFFHEFEFLLRVFMSIMKILMKIHSRKWNWERKTKIYVFWIYKNEFQWKNFHFFPFLSYRRIFWSQKIGIIAINRAKRNWSKCVPSRANYCLAVTSPCILRHRPLYVEFIIVVVYSSNSNVNNNSVTNRKWTNLWAQSRKNFAYLCCAVLIRRSKAYYMRLHVYQLSLSIFGL